ncbi:MAG: histidine phosphatase family protein [Prevotella sp.]|nr:histidine phosphatase family protein [Staphylococcus sp.]MCM1350191.1 histidine phosphatase family protein [Prevotella sp.]
MKTIICLIRHGQTNWNQSHLIQGRLDQPLNDTGRMQLMHTAKRLSTYPIQWDIVLSSPLSRAYESAQIIQKTLQIDVPIIKRNQLIEREFGSAEGLEITPAVYEKILKDEYAGMESTSTIQARARQEILEIASLYEGKHILIVTHSHFIKALFTTLDSRLTFQSFLENGNLNWIEIDHQEIVHYQFNQ